MPHYSDEEIERARQMDLLTYLQTYEPYKLVKVSHNTYCTKEHDSLKISNGLWHWFSRGVGGKSALDYLIAVEGYSFQQGLEIILGRAAAMPSVSYAPKQAKKENVLTLPERADNNKAVTRYLQNRGICNEVIRFCIRTERLYEGITRFGDAEYHNAVFVGMDGTGTPKYGCLRGLNTSFKGEAYGSDKRYSFCIPAEKEDTVLHLFEAAVDLLSFATLEKQNGRSWRNGHLLSLAGVYDSKDKDNIPLALEQYLIDHRKIKEICLHLDNDEIGRKATEQITAYLSDKYTVYDCPPKCGKDVNDELLQTKRKKEEMNR